MPLSYRIRGITGRPLASRGLTQCRSIPTATDLFRRVTDTTSRCCLRASIRMPSRPASGPPSSRTRCPTSRNGHGSAESPDSMAVRMAVISSSSMGTGTFPIPTKWRTPGIVKRGSRRSGAQFAKYISWKERHFDGFRAVRPLMAALVDWQELFKSPIACHHRNYPFGARLHTKSKPAIRPKIVGFFNIHSRYKPAFLQATALSVPS